MIKQDITKYIKEQYNLEVVSIDNMAEGVSDSFLLTSLQCQYILKMIPTSFEQTIVNSLEILRYLEQYSYPSPKVVMTITKKLFSTYRDGSLAVLYQYTEGTDLDDDINYSKLGQLVGLLHRHMDNYMGLLKTQGKDYFIDRYIAILYQKKYPIDKINDYKRLGDLLWNKVKHLPLGYCHGDLHKGNIIKDLNGNYQLLDFDTSNNGYSIHDVMLVCNSTNYFKFEKQAFKQTILNFKEFLKGYDELKVLDNTQIECFYYFMGIYHFQLQATIIEIHGMDCIDHQFIDKQFMWLKQWQTMCEEYVGLSF